MSDIKFSKEDIKFSKDGIKFSKEDNSSLQAEEFKLGYQRFNLPEPSLDEEEVEEAFILNKRAKTLHSTTEMEHYIKDDTSTPTIEAFKEGPSSSSTPPRDFTPSIIFATSGEIVRQVDFEKDEKKDNSFRFDVFDGEVEEEVVVSSSSTASPESTPEPTIFDPPATSTASSIEKEDPVVFKRIFRESEMRNLRGDNSEPGDVSTNQSKSKLDWLEETYEEEVKEEMNQTVTENTVNAETSTPLEFVTQHRNNKNENVSNISKDEEKRQRKQTAEDIINKKEMNLLNSLDYGTGEKSVKEGSNSKESTEDKYATGAFDS